MATAESGRYLGHLIVRDGRMNGNDWGTSDNAELRMLLNRLERSELDFQTRLAERVEALGGSDPSISDPLYQRHYFALEALKAQLAAVEGELSLRGALGGQTDPVGQRC